MKAPKNYFC